MYIGRNFHYFFTLTEERYWFALSTGASFFNIMTLNYKRGWIFLCEWWLGCLEVIRDEWWRYECVHSDKKNFTGSGSG